jgi:hypothetical protein
MQTIDITLGRSVALVLSYQGDSCLHGSDGSSCCSAHLLPHGHACGSPKARNPEKAAGQQAVISCLSQGPAHIPQTAAITVAFL